MLDQCSRRRRLRAFGPKDAGRIQRRSVPCPSLAGSPLTVPRPILLWRGPARLSWRSCTLLASTPRDVGPSALLLARERAKEDPALHTLSLTHHGSHLSTLPSRSSLNSSPRHASLSPARRRTRPTRRGRYRSECAQGSSKLAPGPPGHTGRVCEPTGDPSTDRQAVDRTS
jgi:hypothetical protein